MKRPHPVASLCPACRPVCRRQLITVFPTHHLKTSAFKCQLPVLHSVLPRAQGVGNHPHCTDEKTEAGSGQRLAQDHTAGWRKHIHLAPSSTHSLLPRSSALDPPRPPAELSLTVTMVLLVGCTPPTKHMLHVLHQTPRVLSFMLYWTFFFFCKSSVLTGISGRKLKCAKKILILSRVPSQIPPGHTQYQPQTWGVYSFIPSPGSKKHTQTHI